MEVEQKDDIKTEEVYERVKVEVKRSIKLLTESNINDLTLHGQLIWKLSQLHPSWMHENLQKVN